MKTNIQKVKYNVDPNEPDKCDWWSWDECCDNCGIINYYFGAMITNQKPDDTEKDYCLNCIRKYIDESK